MNLFLCFWLSSWFKDGSCKGITSTINFPFTNYCQSRWVLSTWIPDRYEKFCFIIISIIRFPFKQSNKIHLWFRSSALLNWATFGIAIRPNDFLFNRQIVKRRTSTQKLISPVHVTSMRILGILYKKKADDLIGTIKQHVTYMQHLH